DRFGALPRSVDNLVDVVRVKQLARELRVRVVDLGSDSVRLTLSEASLERAPILDLMNAHPRLYRLTPEMVFEVKRSRNTALDGLGELKKTLRDLIQHANKQ
ncbi:MAG: hypothetical protein KC609_21090, partial [Myxococcales bacterium]|nr:hypothetical protein [Myxococcales bacterium]